MPFTVNRDDVDRAEEIISQVTKEITGLENFLLIPG